MRVKPCDQRMFGRILLLVAHVFIGGDKDIETGRLGCVEQVTVAESIPPAIFGFCDSVT